MKWMFCLLYVMMIMQLPAQEKIIRPGKVPPTLYEFRKLDQDKQQNFFIVTTDRDRLKQFLSDKNLRAGLISEYRNSNLFVIRTTWRIVDSLFIHSSLVTFVDIVRTPREETIIDGFDLAVNKVNLTHDEFKSINGRGTVVSVKENKPDSNDIDLKGRFITTTTSSPVITSHATIMATIIGGAGNSFTTGRGAAWGADITSSNFTNLLPDTDVDYTRHAIAVQNHSYGTAIENYYGADAAAYDASTISNPSLLHVFSAGNSGNKASTAGSYSGLAGFANLTGSFKMAKNIITVGGIESGYTIPPLSSRGPAYDGRLSPHLVAFAQDGTSGAAALVSGTALLLQQAYKEINGQMPPSALIKSVLVNSAEDVGPKGIDFQSGYGNLNAYNAMQTIINKKYFSGTVANGEQRTHLLNLPPNVHQLKITICWNDVPANANSNQALVNDIDLRLVHGAAGHSWQPWVLNSYAHPDSLSALPTRTRDSLNNVEQITIDSPASGAYTIEVSGFHIWQAPQQYYITYEWDSINQFKWQFPTTTDHLQANDNAILRWESTLPTQTGELYYSSDQGNTWTLVSDKVDLDKSYFPWSVADSYINVVFRMTVNNRDFFSDTTTISGRLRTGVGFNCNDSFSFHWSKKPAVGSYTVYRLGANYMEPFQSTIDTAIVLKKPGNAFTHYAVAPNVQGKPGMKSYAFNYNTQGTGCYVQSFLVDLANRNVGDILLELGSVYGVKEVIIEKLTPNGFVALKVYPNASLLDYSFSDTTLFKGGNSYRARINLSSGQTIYSNVETIYYLPDMRYLVFPNPAKTNFQLISKDSDNAELVIYNSTGQKVLTKKITSPLQTISIHQLNKGVYFIVLLERNNKVFHGSLVVQ